jgi:hypothetical protein
MTRLKKSNRSRNICLSFPTSVIAVLLLWPAVSSAATLVVTQNTTLTADHHGPVIMAKNNVTLDCGGFRIIGDGTGHGLTVAGRTGVTVRQCHVTNFATGFWISGSSGNTIESSSSSHNQLANDNQPAGWHMGAGFWIQSSPANVFRWNNAHDNPSDGWDVFNSTGNSFIENRAQHNAGAGFFTDKLSSALNFTGNYVEFNLVGFLITGGSGHVFQQNSAAANTNEGFVFVSVSESSLIRNAPGLNLYGMVLSDSQGNLLEENSGCMNTEYDLVIGDAVSTNNTFLNNSFCRIYGM